MSNKWTPSFTRYGLHYYVWRLKHSDFLGSTYEHYVENGKPVRFLRKFEAQEFADRLNQQPQGGEDE